MVTVCQQALGLGTRACQVRVLVVSRYAEFQALLSCNPDQNRNRACSWMFSRDLLWEYLLKG